MIQSLVQEQPCSTLTLVTNVDLSCSTPFHFVVYVWQYFCVLGTLVVSPSKLRAWSLFSLQDLVLGCGVVCQLLLMGMNVTKINFGLA